MDLSSLSPSIGRLLADLWHDIWQETREFRRVCALEPTDPDIPCPVWSPMTSPHGRRACKASPEKATAPTDRRCHYVLDKTSENDRRRQLTDYDIRVLKTNSDARSANRGFRRPTMAGIQSDRKAYGSERSFRAANWFVISGCYSNRRRVHCLLETGLTGKRI